jgi:hypothetical protein
MSGIPFHQTQMGYAFITKTVPEALREITRLADGIEKLSGILEKLLAAQQSEPGAKPDAEEERR